MSSRVESEALQIPSAPLEVPFLRSIALLVTYRCQIACPHCIVEAGPHRTEEMPVADACGWIEQAIQYRNDHVMFVALTGGEPFYNIAQLKQISTFAAKKGFCVSAVTNAHWAASPASAVEVLREVPGITQLSFSADSYHESSIPFGRVVNAVHAAQECGIPFSVAISTENADDPRYKDIVERVRQLGESITISTAITFPVGRAGKALDGARFPWTSEPPPSACWMGSSPVIFPDGRVIACCGPVIDLKSSHPLCLGDLRRESLEQIFERAEMNTILHAIRLWGPSGLIGMARDAGLRPYLPRQYVEGSICHACYDLMREPHLVECFARLAENEEFARKVAYARVFYLKETYMAERLGLALKSKAVETILPA